MGIGVYGYQAASVHGESDMGIAEIEPQWIGIDLKGGVALTGSFHEYGHVR